ncbi:MAG: 1,2-phenylacetyl-CoA epoxidase subunit PaaE [Dermatophilaceae bacterium]
MVDTATPGQADLPTTSPVGRRHLTFHTLRVAAVDRLTEDAVAVTFDVPAELREQFQFKPGQHVSVRSKVLGDRVRRNYSICAPAGSGRLRIGVKRIPNGVFSGFATEKLLAGDVLDVLTPSGSFTIDPDATRAHHYGAIAAGSGITPVLSILSTALEQEPHSRATLIYVNRTTSNIMFLEELEDLKNAYPSRFQLIHVLDYETVDVDILSGRLDADRLNRILHHLIQADEIDDWFLCGPLPMTDAARQVLMDAGADPEHIHRELFHVGGPAVASAAPPPDEAATKIGSSVTVMLDGRSQSFILAPNGPAILDALIEFRPDAPYACKNGVCGTCRAKVMSGDVSMDSNFALEPYEMAAGFVLTCQAHPVSDHVTVDFDQ